MLAFSVFVLCIRRVYKMFIHVFVTVKIRYALYFLYMSVRPSVRPSVCMYVLFSVCRVVLIVLKGHLVMVSDVSTLKGIRMLLSICKLFASSHLQCVQWNNYALFQVHKYKILAYS